jgi:hypothetical protein
MSKIGLYDVVELVEDLPGTIFRAGMTGTVVETFKSGAFEVEFEELEALQGGVVSAGFWPHQLRRQIAFADMGKPSDSGKTALALVDVHLA